MLRAPQIDHTEYPRRLRSRSVAELRYTIADCKTAIAANPENPKCGYYADEIHYCAAELRRRGE